MGSRNIISVSGKLHTLNGAAALNVCGVNSSVKGATVALSVLTDSPERINIWYLRAPGEGATEYLDFKDVVDIRTCTLDGGSERDAVRITGKNGELYVLECKSLPRAQELAAKLIKLGETHLENNRETAARLQLTPEGSSAASADHIVIPNEDPAAQAAGRKGKSLHVLGIVMQTIGYLLLIGLAGTFLNDGGGVDWTGAGFGIAAMIALIVGGIALAKKN